MNNEKHVVFGTGPLGKAVMEQLLQQGKKVIMASKSGQASLPPFVELVACDARDGKRVAELCKDVAVVYNCIGLPYQDWGMFPSIIEGLINGLAETKAILVHADNLYAYGPSANAFTEETDCQPVGPKTSIRAAMANRVIEAHKQGVVRTTIGRAPDFYGPGVRESVLGSRVIGNMMEGKPVEVIGNIDMPHSVIYIKDFASGLILLAGRQEALGQVWHIPCNEPLTLRELIEACARELGTTPKYRTANKLILHIMGIFSRQMKEFKEIYYQFDRPFIVHHQKFSQTFSMEPTPYPEAIKETIHWYLENTNKNSSQKVS